LYAIARPAVCASRPLENLVDHASGC